MIAIMLYLTREGKVMEVEQKNPLFYFLLMSSTASDFVRLPNLKPAAKLGPRFARNDRHHK